MRANTAGRSTGTREPASCTLPKASKDAPGRPAARNGVVSQIGLRVLRVSVLHFSEVTISNSITIAIARF